MCYDYNNIIIIINYIQRWVKIKIICMKIMFLLGTRALKKSTVKLNLLLNPNIILIKL